MSRVTHPHTRIRSSSHSGHSRIGFGIVFFMP
jgi:hypothetical protein